MKSSLPKYSVAHPEEEAEGEETKGGGEDREDDTMLDDGHSGSLDLHSLLRVASKKRKNPVDVLTQLSGDKSKVWV
jgi:hypothetical protein